MAATFTVSACPAVEARIGSDLALLRDAILQVLPAAHVRMLALCGGFGRGEGTAFLTNGQPRIVNDYDIRVVHDFSPLYYGLRYAARLEKVAEDYARRLPIKQIDVGAQDYRDLRRTLAPTIANYELLHGYHVFHGEDLFQPLASGIQADAIPRWEGTWLLRNRAIGLILAGLYFLGGLSPQEDERENLWIEANKAMLAAGDAFLLAQGRYHWSYVERGRRMGEWAEPGVPPWREAYCRAVAAKVDPGPCPYGGSMDKLIDDWYRAQDVLQQSFLWFEARRTGRPWAGWGGYLDQCTEGPIWRRPRFWANLLRARTRSPVDAARRARLRTERIRSVGLVARLLFAVGSSGIDGDAVDHVARVVGLNCSGTAVARWRQLAVLLLSSIHPTGEAGRVAARSRQRIP